MTNLTSHQIAEALELLAKELRERPDFTTGFTVSDKYKLRLSDYTSKKQEFIDFAKNLGNVIKGYDGDNFELIFGSGIAQLRLWGSRSSVCHVVKPAQPAVYECEPLLTPEEEKEMGVR